MIFWFPILYTFRKIHTKGEILQAPLPPPVIELRDVSFSYPRMSDSDSPSKTLFKNVNLALYANEIVALMGPSGVGKSALIKIMAGLLEPVQGEVFAFGQSLQLLSPAKRAHLWLKMGMLFQKNALFDSLSVAENVEFPLVEIAKLSIVEARTKARELLTLVGLESSASKRVFELSGGMQKRLGIARAMSLEPKILFFDDPTAGLDPITGRQIMETIRTLQKKSHSTVVLVTHEVPRAFQIASRFFIYRHESLSVHDSAQSALEDQDPRVREFIYGQLNAPE